jgi:hypothetical protein
MDPDIKGHTISDSLETLQALSIENNTIGDPLSLTKMQSINYLTYLPSINLMGYYKEILLLAARS